MPTEAWKSRIVGHGEEAPDQLLANPANWRDHPKAQQAALNALLTDVGWVQDIIVNQRTGHVVDGHLRVRLAMKRDEPTVPVVYVDLSEAEERLVLAAIDPIAAMAKTDRDKLADLLAHTTSEQDALIALLDDLAREAGVSERPKASIGDDSAPIDEAEELRAKWDVQADDLWLVPSASTPGRSHRLLVGDATSAAAGDRLFSGEVARLVHTDPPYGVDYATLVDGKKNQKKGGWEKIAGDELRGDELIRFLTVVFRHAHARAAETAALYAWHASATRDEFSAALKNSAWTERQYLVWAKPGMVMGHGDYQWSHEPCFYCGKDGATPAFYADRTQVTVWRLSVTDESQIAATLGPGLLVSDGEGTSVYLAPAPPKGKKVRRVQVRDGERLFIQADDATRTVWELGREGKSLHPTQKPIALAHRAIINSSRPGDVVFDPFLGSGTTALGAEVAGRLCYATDLDPRYIAVAIERFARAGLKPRRSARA